MSYSPPLCPVHLYERQRCSPKCLPQRIEYRRISQALRVYWWHRKHGWKPMSALEYRARYAGRWDVRG